MLRFENTYVSSRYCCYHTEMKFFISSFAKDSVSEMRRHNTNITPRQRQTFIWLLFIMTKGLTNDIYCDYCTNASVYRYYTIFLAINTQKVFLDIWAETLSNKVCINRQALKLHLVKIYKPILYLLILLLYMKDWNGKYSLLKRLTVQCLQKSLFIKTSIMRGRNTRLHIIWQCYKLL